LSIDKLASPNIIYWREHSAVADLYGVPDVLPPRRGSSCRTIALDELVKESGGMENLDAPLSGKASQTARFEQIETLAVKRRAVKDDSHEHHASEWSRFDCEIIGRLLNMGVDALAPPSSDFSSHWRLSINRWETRVGVC
jgi:hypothetical protein